LCEPDTPSDGKHFPFKKGKQITEEVEFLELPGAADGILIGCQQLSDWGFSMSTGDDGRMWCELRTLGLCMPVDRKRPKSMEITAMSAITAEGPRMVPVPVRARSIEVETMIG
jgi:hypothetical protein